MYMYVYVYMYVCISSLLVQSASASVEIRTDQLDFLAKGNTTFSRKLYIAEYIVIGYII